MPTQRFQITAGKLPTLTKADKVLLLGELVASVVTHDNVGLRVDVVYIAVKLFLAGDIRCIVGRHLRLPLGCLAHGAGAIRVRQLAFPTLPVGANAMVSIVGALNDMALVTFGALSTITEGGEGATNRS